ncbi:MAG: ferredoxin [Acidimicrobiia bacterium]|nr:ferredoxin [Acidimicrobiia bacterium]MCY4457320.1 ferredoxin [Acidimicrobiaceae bacterium]
MKLHLDTELCQGHSRCVMVAPELFDADEDGYSMLLHNGDVPASLHNKARLAVDNCPEYAIEVLEG